MGKHLGAGTTSTDLIKLLALAGAPPGPDTEANALSEILDTPITFDERVPTSVPNVLGRPCDELRKLEGRTVGDVLTGADAGAPARATLKDYVRGLARGNCSTAVEAATKAAYYAAIAGALVFCDKKVSRLSYEKLGTGLAALEEQPWLPAELRSLFARARVLCEQRSPPKRTSNE